MSTSTLLTLPPHLRDTIQQLVSYSSGVRVDLPTDLRDDLIQTLSGTGETDDTSPARKPFSRGEEGLISDDFDAGHQRSGSERESESESESRAGGRKKTRSAPSSVVLAKANNNAPSEPRPWPRQQLGHEPEHGNEDGDGDSSGEASKRDEEANDEQEEDEDEKVDTIPLDLVERLSRWCSTEQGRRSLQKAKVDPIKYSVVSLMAGTEVYIPPYELERLRAAENPDKPNPYLPSYFSPSPPSLGSEYRALIKQLTTALNIIFSIIGSAAAVYVASTSGAGYTRETAVLLAVLTGAVVGLADLGLVVIFSKRLEGSRKERFENSVKALKGSGKVDEPTEDQMELERKTEEGDGTNRIGSHEGDADVDEVGSKSRNARIDDDKEDAQDHEVQLHTGTDGRGESAQPTSMEKRQVNVRLRRKKLDEA
ncbi:hypothetical protein I317_01477 [Kwoniella heveanensis CBS 569]|nr:hypothetical protein I317_01477 [Kwoniella heveanensis CBS 569]